MLTIEQEFAEEREYQDAKWGGPSHDDTHTEGDWCDFIKTHWHKPNVPLRRRLKIVGALAIAALQSHIRKCGGVRYDLATILGEVEKWNNERLHKDEKVLRKWLWFQMYHNDQWHNSLCRIIAKCYYTIEWLDREPAAKSDQTKLLDHLNSTKRIYNILTGLDRHKEKFPGCATTIAIQKLEFHHFDENGKALGIDLAD